TKSGSREIFREAGVPLPDGFEHLHTPDEIAAALAALKQRDPSLRKAVVKLDEGFSGEGNAIFSYAGAPASCCAGDTLERWVADVLPERLQFEAKTETWDHYAASFAEMGGIVEAFVDGARKTSPSVQCRVDPTGRATVISTHEQVLGGPSGQVFLGCTFPAAAPYRMALQEAGERIGAVLAERGALGRFGVDFLCVEDPAAETGWRYVAIEINLRKGGTTHPYLMLDFLTDGAYDPETGLYRAPSGQPRYYYASDNLTSKGYRGLTPYDLVDLAVYHGLHFHGATQEGVVFHLIGALSEFGKLGVLCIGATPERAQALYDETVALLDRETAA
ncbi:MAG: peptide ligase PGM1-related protein, partial [Bacteroidota bacterium]